MKPVKIKLLKRTWTGQECEEYELSSPSKKTCRQKAEKENVEDSKIKKAKAKKEKKSTTVLTESPIASRRTNVRVSDSDSDSPSSASSDSDSDDLDEIFRDLKKFGVKTVKSSSGGKSSSKTPSSQTKNGSSKKSNIKDDDLTSGLKFKKKLLDEFDDLPESKALKRKSFRRKSSTNEENVKPHEDVNSVNIDNKTSIKKSQNAEFDMKTPEKTPKKADNLFGSRSSSRRKSSKNDSIVDITSLEQIPEGSEIILKTRRQKASNITNELEAQKVIPEDSGVANESNTRRKSLRSAGETYVPELEKLPEDLILNYKRTPKQTNHYTSEFTPIKTRSETPRKSSTRGRRTSLLLNEDVFTDGETTPKKRRSIRLTPMKSSSTKKKENSLLQTPTHKIEERLPTTPLEKARLSLHVSAVPDGLPCREKEFNNILNFVKNKLLDGIGGCMYISGVPGTGKTATVTQVIKELRVNARNGEVPEFRYIEINGMRLSDPRQAYVEFWQKLFNKEERISSERAQKILDSWFNRPENGKQGKTTVLLVDELDLICTKKQDVVYNLLDWPTRTHSRLVVLTIANTMDMPERLFKGRITSRMGLTRLTFMPYTFKQLEEIVSERLKGLDAFVPDAVQLVTRKVAAVSGDARRALDICRRAAELPAPDETVKISHIEQAIKEMTNSNIVRVIRDCSTIEKLFLRALCDVTFRSNIDEIEVYKVIDHLVSICILEGVPCPPVTSILTVCHRLKCSRLIFSNQSYPGILQRVMLNITQDDVHYALQS